MQQSSIVEPIASSLIEALRAVGYNLETAIADIIDNSISAGASRVDILFHWDKENSFIRIEDDGCGMDEKKLIEAMRVGSQNPLAKREESDLGRFGLGLKTASFSQCRRLTVLSKASQGAQNIKCWDLDVIKERNQWLLIDGCIQGTTENQLKTILNSKSGTIVLWQKLDRIISDANLKTAYNNFLYKIELTEKHISKVFHRLLSKTCIAINGNRIKPWNPFLERHPAAQILPNEQFYIGDSIINVEPYILPHESRLSSEEYELTSGTKGWNGQQGFYIYRNKRLLVDGSWLGMFRKEEQYRLARIKIDIPNDVDLDWKIDVKKAAAFPPECITEQLKRIAKRTREAAAKVYRHRGSKLARSTEIKESYVWNQIQQKGQIKYTINREHFLIKKIIKENKVSASELYSLLSMIEETIPIHLITAQIKENETSYRLPFEGKTKELETVINNLYTYLAAQGKSMDQIKKELLVLEPFSGYPELVEAVLNKGGKKYEL